MRRSLLFGVVMAISVVFPAEGQQAPATPRAPSPDDVASLFANAAARTNVLVRGTVPFHLRAHLKCFLSRGKPVEGTYDLWWESPGRWRVEIAAGGTTGVVAQRSRSRWGKLSDVQRLIDLRFDTAWTTGTGLRLYEGERVGKVERQQLEGVAADCFFLNVPGKPVDVAGETFSLPSFRREICLDAMGGLPLREKEDYAGREFEYGDYVALGLRRVPEKLRYALNGKPLLEAVIDSLDALENPDEKLFDPPEGSPTFTWCADFQPATPAGSMPPIYGSPTGLMPGTAPSLGAVTAVSFLIRADGKVHDFKVLDRQGFSALVDGQLESLRRGLYHPATCGGNPVDFPVVMEVNIQPNAIVFPIVHGKPAL
jgi:hypothetical protein